MIHKEFQPEKLYKGDWLCIAYHSDMLIRVLDVDGRKVTVSGMPCPLMYGEYWPVELSQKTIDKAELNDVITEMDKQGLEHKYVHQVQHYIRDNDLKIDIIREFI